MKEDRVFVVVSMPERTSKEWASQWCRRAVKTKDEGQITLAAVVDDEDTGTAPIITATHMWVEVAR